MTEKLSNQAVILETIRKIRFNPTLLVIPTYIAAIAMAEAIGVFGNVVLGTLGHTLLVLVLLNHYALKAHAPYRRVLPALALMPLLRLLSLTMVIKAIPQLYWYALIGVPLLLAAALTARLLELSWTRLGLRPSAEPRQIVISLSGVPLSVVAFLLLRPQPLIAGFHWPAMLVAAMILIVFTGLTEEIIFRGILQQVASELYGRTGFLYSSALFAIMYIGSPSLSYLIFIGLVGLGFGWWVRRTGSIWGVGLAHGLLSIGLLLVWPLVWG